MTHIHEWTIDHQIIGEENEMLVGECFAYCGCGEELRYEELMKRINATERLSAKDARLCENYVTDVVGEEALLAYASTLEDEA